jgi:hypothetical protein
MRGLDHENRNLGIEDQGLRDAADEELPDRGSAASTDDQQVCLGLVAADDA